ncbi:MULTISPECIES: hypothetical protein [unclassified Pseudodesulfovibrio]|uniref:hypothetical protein n=1 Tax=unclassified Pseudodesulfovibrio TaxID=2661612 RepID=UPI000FEB9434|nr:MULTISPECIES: hypothetical protein [unclassified Pseudodesulfovibrio]MCJ2165421.1 hypothetical protein [Pseudodesulfovibrio sp. S3-i]RWU03174.1 hypothetical protein DWB63_12320 [Pseudodesulfovibrio sp. S3]
MKKIALPLVFLALLGLCAPALAQSWNLSALKAQAAKAVPDGQMTNASADDAGAFVSIQAGDLNYQFTLASDQDPQMADAEQLDYQGRTAYFFEAMPGSGGLMILLDTEKSLTILLMPGMESETDLTAADMTAIVDNMDLEAL